ncbi:MAG: LysM domain-containing protein [Pseudomonadota bacterium]
MRHIIFALIFSFSTAAFAQGEAPHKPVELAPDAPERHIVVPGDTLWGIAAKFLKDPFRWPEVWKMNAEQVKNPHRIYPGQVVILDMSSGEPRLKLGTVKLDPTVRVEMVAKEIPAIPSQAIEPFLSQPLVVDLAQFETSPRVIATQENRVFTGNGDTIYASGIDPKVRQWQIYRPGKPLIDPDSKETLGVEAIYLGNARVVGDPAEVTTLEVTTVKEEIGRGDRLVPASRPEVLSYMPRVPEQEVSGRVLNLYGGVGEGGRHSTISISRGQKDGLAMGHVLAIYRAGATVTNRFADDKPQTHVLPDERYGLLFVFRVFERVSYGLVIDASRPVIPGDRVRKP